MFGMLRVKPPHGWNPVLWELGIVTLGVLIALGAQQLVEEWSWQSKARRAVTALRSELSLQYSMAAEAVVTAPCVDRQLELLENRLVSSTNAGLPAPLYSDDARNHFVFRAPSRPWPADVWNSIVTEGVASHLDGALRGLLRDQYAQIEIMRENNRQTDPIGWRLNMLAKPVLLDSATKARMIETIEDERGHFDYLALVGRQITGRVRDMKLLPPTKVASDYLANSGTIKFCRAHGLPLASMDSKAR
ncbi:MAG: hypothetical protein ABIR87_08395 [Sphingomicrobium sp.]